MPRRAAILVAALIVSCGPALTQEQQAIQVGHAHVQARFHYSQDIERLPPIVEDRGDHWSIKFRGPPGAVGGNAWVDIRKSDFGVLGSIADQ